MRTEPAASPELSLAKEDLAAAFQMAARQGYDDGIWNHFSLRVPGTRDRFLAKCHGPTFAEVTASTLAIVDLEGTVIEGDGIVEASAFFLHAQIHRAREDAVCALHAHTPYATAVTCLEGGRLRWLHQDSLRFVGRVAYYDDYGGLALAEGEAEKMISALGNADVLFLKNHGVIVLGRSVADAYYSLHYLEVACRRQILALSSGETVADIPLAVAEATSRQFEEERDESSALHFAALKRELDREHRPYRD